MGTKAPSSAVPVYLFTITLYFPYKYIVKLKTTNSKKVASGLILRFALSNMTSQ